MKLFTSLLFSIFLSIGIMAQSQVSSKTIQHLSESYEQLGLKASDIENVIVDHAYTDKNGVRFIYLIQTHEGIPVYNAIMTIVISKKGKIITTGNRFISDLKSKIASTKSEFSAQEAIKLAATHFKTETTVFPTRTDSKTGVEYFMAKDLVNKEIPVSYKYEVDAEGKLHKAYDLSLDMKANSDWWSIRIDAATGEILSKTNWTVYCNHEGSHSHENEECVGSMEHNTNHAQDNAIESNSSILNDGASYRVYQFPIESPNYGAQSLLVNPADPEASPLGWHDINGSEGADYNTTRGNNVWVYLDSLAQNSSQGDEVNGGTELIFDATHDKTLEIRDNVEAAQINLFYANNFMHDFTYHLGFDEAAGNFQHRNYSNLGKQGDEVNAEAFDGLNLYVPIVQDTMFINNANFSTPADGASGRMQMYAWENPEGSFSIETPLEIAELVTQTGTATFGPPVSVMSVSGKVALAIDDNPSNPTQVCSDIINPEAINGNVAIIERGECNFDGKVLRAQQAGAIAVMICNVSGVDGGNGDETINMGAPTDGTSVAGQIDIPSLFIQKSICDKIKASISNGIDVTVTFEERDNGPNLLDGCFDNGVIAHEFAHGISNRLTAGPNNVGCLPVFDDNGDGNPDRGEQMGEGWSDYFSLISTLKNNDLAERARGIGTYVDGGNANSRGIRRFPYSTDMTVCPLTYDDIISGSVPHGVGEVWAATLWDLNWAFIELYGIDDTWTDTNSGNFRAARLVIDGLKLQDCRPGYVDGRDAILSADLINNDGDHQCLIWEVFARRGIGFYAVQGESTDHRDNQQNFDPMPTCIEKLKVEREIAQLVQPGATLLVNAKAINHIPGDAVQVFVTEKLEDGLSYVEGSAPFPATVTGNEVMFDLGMMEYLAEVPFTYNVKSTTSIKSATLNLEDLEDSGSSFNFVNYNEGFNVFAGINGRNGTKGLGAVAPETEVDLALITPTYEIPSDPEVLPALRFWHKFDLEPFADAVFISISTDGGNNWIYVTDFLKNGYTHDIQYGTFAIPALRAFSGSTNGEFIDSYIDLSAYKGEDILVRFRLGSDDNTAADAEFSGWIVDDIELMDLKLYNVETCIGTVNNLDQECNPNTTIIVDSSLAIDTKDATSDIYDMIVYPNPAKSKLYLDVSSPITENVQIKLTSVDGRLIRSSNTQLNNNVQTIGFNILNLDKGMYLIQVQSENGLSTRKFVKN